MNIIITGGSSGLGAEAVKALATDAHNIFFTYASSREAAKALEEGHENVAAVHCDFTDETSVSDFVAKMASFDADVLINNANGGIHKDHFYRTNPDVFLSSFQHNVMPTLRITQEAMKLFRKKKFGKIINIVSAALVSKPPIGWAEYVANKAYLLAMSKVWATEGIKFNITSNSISPGFMQTKLTSDTDDRVIESMIEAHPLRKLLTPGEVANAVLFFVNASQQVNGTNLVINAGTDLVG